MCSCLCTISDNSLKIAAHQPAARASNRNHPIVTLNSGARLWTAGECPFVSLVLNEKRTETQHSRTNVASKCLTATLWARNSHAYQVAWTKAEPRTPRRWTARAEL